MKSVIFFFKSLKENTCILLQEQRWYFALIVLIISLVASVSGTLATGYMQNLNGVLSTSTETCIREAVEMFAEDLNDNDDDAIFIQDGNLMASGKFATYTDPSLDIVNQVIAPNATYTWMVPAQESDSDSSDSTSVAAANTYVETPILNVWVFSTLDPINSSTDSDILNSFLRKSVYKYDSDENPTWSPVSFIIFTRTSVNISTYQVIGATSSSSYITSGSGSLQKLGNLDLATLLGDDQNATVANFTAFLNDSYKTLSIPSTWIQVGIFAAINVAVIFLGGFIFWLATRNKKEVSGLSFNFWQAQKVAYFESLTPAIFGLILTFFLSSLMGTFIFIGAFALRISSSVSKLGNNRNKKDDKPVYKARS